MISVANLANLFRLLKDPNYGTYSGGSALSLVGLWAERVAVGWLAWELTGSGAWLGLMAFADLFPTVVLGPICGAAADRWNRLNVTRITQALAVAQASTLAITYLTGNLTIWLLFGLNLFLGCINALNQPARLAMVPSLVERKAVGAAVAIYSISNNLARFIGPAIAGLVIAAGGVFWAFIFYAFTAAIFLLLLTWVRLTRVTPPPATRGSFFAEVGAGLRYAATAPGIGYVLLLMAATNLGAKPLIELMPGFAVAVFASGATGLATMTSSIGAGAVAAGFWLGGKSANVRLTRVVLGCSLGLALAGLLFCAISQLWLAVPVLLCVGFFMTSTAISSQTLIQLAVPDLMRGRVLSLHGIISRGGPALGALLMGITSEVLGLRWPVVIGCLAVIACWLWVSRKSSVIATALESEPAAD